MPKWESLLRELLSRTPSSIELDFQKTFLEHKEQEPSPWLLHCLSVVVHLHSLSQTVLDWWSFTLYEYINHWFLRRQTCLSVIYTICFPSLEMLIFDRADSRMVPCFCELLVSNAVLCSVFCSADKNSEPKFTCCGDCKFFSFAQAFGNRRFFFFLHIWPYRNFSL